MSPDQLKIGSFAAGKPDVHYPGEYDDMTLGPDPIADRLRRDNLSSLYGWCVSLLIHLRDHPNTLFQALSLFSWPYILPQPDSTLAKRLIPELLALRSETIRYFGEYAGRNPGIIDSEEAVRTIEDGRRLIKEIHGIWVTFDGEQPHSITINGDHYGNIIQSRDISGGVHITVDPGDDPEMLRDPLEIDVYVTKGSHAGVVAVDANPARAMAVSGILYVVTVRSRTKLPVILDRARLVVISRHSPRRACFKKPILGTLEPRKFTTNLDENRPRLSAEGQDFPFTVRDKDPEQFWFEPVAQQMEIAWQLEIDWSAAGKNYGTVVIDRNGKPFETYPLNVLFQRKYSTQSRLHWACNDVGPCKPDCPSRRIPPGALGLKDIYGRV